MSLVMLRFGPVFEPIISPKRMRFVLCSNNYLCCPIVVLYPFTLEILLVTTCIYLDLSFYLPEGVRIGLIQVYPRPTQNFKNWGKLKLPLFLATKS